MNSFCGRGIVIVQRPQEFLDGRRRLVSSVEWHLVEEVMGHVSTADLVMEEVEDTVWSVNRG